MGSTHRQWGIFTHFEAYLGQKSRYARNAYNSPAMRTMHALLWLKFVKDKK